MVLALAVAVLHAAAVLLLLTGALLGLRYRRVLLVHAPVAAAIALVHVAGADCPLTTWERALRTSAGHAYEAGFLDHYVLGPLGLDSGDPAVHLGIYAVVLVPNLVGYGLLAAKGQRGLRRRPLGPVGPDATRPPPTAGWPRGRRPGHRDRGRRPAR